MLSHSSPIRVILIDFGKTIHGFTLDRFFNWLEYKYGIPRHHFWDIFSRQPGGLIFQYECGKSNEWFFRAFQKEIRALLKRLKTEEGRLISTPDLTEEEFFEHWNSTMDLEPLDPRLMTFLRKLKVGGYGVFVLSNTNKANLAYFKGDAKNGYRFSRFGELFRTVDRFIASCDADVRARKTRPGGNNPKLCERVFLRALKLCGSRPSETVFIDDIEEYTEAFRSMGGQAIHHTGCWTRTEAELYRLGVRWE